MLLLSRYNKWKADLNDPAIDSRDLKKEEMQIQKGIAHMLGEMEDDEIPDWTDHFEGIEIALLSMHQAKGIEPLGPVWKYRCNRSHQHKTFVDRFGEQEGIFRYYCLFGHDEQSHAGFFNRLYLEYIQDKKFKRSRKIHLSPQKTTDLATLKREFQIQLLREFSLEKMVLDHEPGECMKRWFAHLQNQEKYNSLAIDIRFSSSDWKPHVMQFIQWVKNEYCDESGLDGDKPSIFIFFSFIFEESIEAMLGLVEEEEGGHEELRDAILSLSDHTQVLDELGPVSAVDVVKWIQESSIKVNQKEATKLFLSFFGKPQKEYDMKDVEIKLENIIGAYNEGTL